MWTTFAERRSVGQKLTEQLAQLSEELSIDVRLVLPLVRLLGDHVLDVVLGPVFPGIGVTVRLTDGQMD